MAKTLDRYTGNYLIIGGTTKAGTTSLFKWLGRHPDIDAAAMKETRFFLEDEYPLSSKYRLSRHGIDAYGTYFLGSSNLAWRLEATPDYLYSKSAPDAISDSLLHPYMLFVLRDPIDRLISWYRYSKQDGRLSSKTTLSEYISMQRESEPLAAAPQHLRALEQGRYYAYLQDYWRVFDDAKVLVVLYEDMIEDPGRLVRTLCHRLGIDSSCYDDFDFPVYNRTSSPSGFPLATRVAEDLRMRIRRFAYDKPAVHTMLREVSAGLRRLTRRPKQADVAYVEDSDLAFLLDYYRQDVGALARKMGRKLPWRGRRAEDGAG